MKNKIILPILFSAFFICSCSEDFFDATVSIDVPEHTPALAITSEILAGDSTIGVYVSNSVGILENDEWNPIEDAKVELLKNGQAYAILPYSGFSEKFYILDLDEPFSYDAAEYELRVSASGFEPVNAFQKMPNAVEILSAEFDEQGAINSEGDRLDEFKIEFQDPTGEENFYRLKIWSEDENFGGNYELYLDNLEPLAEIYDGDVYLKDSSFNGKKYTWRVGSYSNFNGAGVKYRVELFTITRDQYLFARSASLSQDNDDNPFAEPVIVHNNLEGGYGIFSLATKDVIVIEP